MGFLENLYRYIDLPIRDWLDDYSDDTIIQLYKFIHSPNVIVYTDESLLVKSQTNPNFKKLFKMEKKPEHRKEDFASLLANKEQFFKNSIYISSIFFMDTLKDSKEIEEFGYLAFCNEEIKNCSFLFCNPVEPLVKGNAMQCNGSLYQNISIHLTP